MAYGFTTIGAFAVVTLVRDSGGETTHLSRWAGLGREAPVVAGVFAFFLLAFAGIPLTSGFTGKWAVFTSAWSGGAWPLVVVAVLMSVVAAFFYVRVIVVMFFSDPIGDGPTVAVPEHPDYRRDHDRGGDDAAPRASCRSRCWTSPAGPASSSAEPIAGILVTMSTPTSLEAHAPWGVPMVDPELEGRVRSRLLDIEKELAQAVASDVDFINEAARHLLDAGGKRFRPLLVVLAAEFGDPKVAEIVPAALVVELTHLATLYHDDVMDEADLRRGAQSANARWDNSVAILTGDFLFARASEIVADLGPAAVKIQSQTFARLVQGQIRETVGPRDGDDPLRHYLSVVADKTGSLIATSARFGARVSSADPRDRARPHRVRRGDRDGLPALRRHHRRGVRRRGPRQDTGHRPARGRADAADADGQAGRRRG